MTLTTVEPQAGAEVSFREYSRSWSLGRIVERDPFRPLAREDVRDQVLRRAYADAEFRKQLLENTRFVMAMAIDQGLGINQNLFLMGVRKFHLAMETQDLLYLKLPRCHKGCAMQEPSGCPLEDRSSCHICGTPNGKSACQNANAACMPEPSRVRIEERMVDRMYRDPDFAGRLERDPLETYVAFAKQLCGGQRPRYLRGVREVRLVRESQSEMYLIFPPKSRFDSEHELDY